MVIEISSDNSSSSSDSNTDRDLDELLKRLNIRVTGDKPLDLIEPFNPATDPPFDPRFTFEGMETEERPIAGQTGNAPERNTATPRNRPCKFLHYFSGEPGEYWNFTQKYQIPEDVSVRLGPQSHGDVRYQEGHLTFPLMAIIEGGVRFPLDPFVRRFLRTLTLSSNQISVNTYRIICSISELRRRYDLPFGLEELFGAYKVSRSGNPPRWYLSSRTKFEELLIEGLPDSEEWASSYVVVSGNFMFGPDEARDTPVQWQMGSPGRYPLSQFPFLHSI